MKKALRTVGYKKMPQKKHDPQRYERNKIKSRDYQRRYRLTKRIKSRIDDSNHTLANVIKYIKAYLKPMVIVEIDNPQDSAVVAMNHLITICNIFKNKLPEDVEKIIEDV